MTAVLWVTVLLVCTGLQAVHNAKILAMFNLASPSHYIFNRALLVALAERGHQVTVISQDQEKKPVPNLKNIVLENMYNYTQESFDYEAIMEVSVWDMMFFTFDWGSSVCEQQLQTRGAQTLLDYPPTESFDLILTEYAWGECFFGFVHKFGSPPVVATSGIGVPPWLSLTAANPEHPAYMPSFLLPLTGRMGLGDRLYNFLVHNAVTFLYHFRHIPTQEAIARKYFKEDLPSFHSIVRNISVVLVNTVLGLDEARPLLPNVVPIGGMHIKAKPDPLPKDLQKFLDEAKDGFIFFSLGSNLRSDALTEAKRKALLDAFSELPQRVLWKFETETLQGLPPNVKISKWLPQSDVLAHPNIRAFISHGGKMSSMEATYRGVPVVGIPFFLDQKINVMRFVSKGVGVHLDFRDITKHSVLATLREVVNNASYRLNMQKLSAVFRDQETSPLERAVYWTEYALRHQGAAHMRSAAQDLYWHQFLLLDVLALLLTAAVALILLLTWTCRTVVRLVTTNIKTKTKTS